ncbi:MAG: tetratricopeptide repeat protein [Calothrix sp. FI2-JRJ7]|jgi:tetratricopeptide (TPR) repeat protein|nr:tetratricopeptide repeat protein [Calothrix sp. FI2-JRJ7]
MQYILYPIAILVLFAVINYLVAFLFIFKSVFRRPKYEIINSKQVPLYLQQLFKGAISELEELGFKACCYVQVEPMLQIDPPTVVEILLYNQSLKSYAKVGIRYPLEAVNLFDIEFYTFFQDSSLLLTMNGKADGVIGETPNFTIQDAYTPETLVQWQLHQDTVEKVSIAKPAIGLSPDKFTIALEKFSNKHLNYLFKAGKLRLVEEKKYSLTLQGAWKVAKKLVDGKHKVTKIINQRLLAAKTNPEMRVDIPVELEVEGFKRTESQNKGLVDGKFRAWMLFISFGLFVASFMHMFEIHRLAIFVLVIMLHEAGHLIAMHLCGYRDTSMLFLPFLGAVATASQKYDTTLTQNVWVLLAGPLPGLILGIFLAFISGNTIDVVWVKDTAWMLIGLNLINLLPIYPLDGGKIANLLLFSRFAYSDVLFQLFGLFVLARLSISQPILFIFILLTAFSIPQSFRAAKANSKLQRLLKQSKPSNQDNLINNVYIYFKQFGYNNLPAASRNFLVKDIIRRYNESQGKWITRISLIVLYCGSLLGALTGSLYAISPRAISFLSEIPHILEKPQQRRERFLSMQKHEIQKATAILQQNPNDVDTYIKRARAFKVMRHHKGALTDYNQIVRLQPNDTKHRFIRASLNSQLGNIKAEIQDYDYLLKLNHKPHIVYYQRAEARTKLRDYFGAIADYNQVIKLNPKSYWNYINRGYIYIQLKDYKGALADANKAIQLEPQLHDAYALRSQVYSKLGNNKAEKADKQKAIALEQALEETPQD